MSLLEQRFDLRKWISENLPIVHQSSAEWLCTCPRCGRDKLAVNVENRAFHCLHAGCPVAGWGSQALIVQSRNILPAKADEIMAAQGLGVHLGPAPTLADLPTFAANKPLLKASLPPLEWVLEGPQLEYLKARNIPVSHCEELGAGTVLSDGSGSKADRNLSTRILFPVYDGGHIVFWAARAIDSHPAKVINMPFACKAPMSHPPGCVCFHAAWGLPPVPNCALADDVVFGGHLIERGKPVIVVEGVTDVARCGPRFVSMLGAKMSPTQAAKLAESGASEAIVLFDGDDAGRKAAPKVGQLLQSAMPTRWMVCPDGLDPGDMGREACLAYVDTPRNIDLPSLNASNHPGRRYSVSRTAVPFLPKLKS